MKSVTVEFSSTTPVKSKKSFLITPIKSTHPPSPSPSPSPSPTTTCRVVSTPDRVNPRTQTRRRNVALSVSDVRRSALLLRKPNPDGSKLVPEMSIRVKCGPANVHGFHQSPLPQKYELLCEFFSAMVSSIRLHRLKRLPASLSKLSRSIESLTHRRFTLHHLAQLKHIVPEVIVVEKIRIQDEETSCMKEELFISLETDAPEIDNHVKGRGGYSHSRRIFRTRITNYATTHPEGKDVPKGELPELFYKPKHEAESSMNQTHVLLPTMLTSPSFKRRFSSRALTSPISEPYVAKPLPETPIKDAPSALVKDVYFKQTIYTDVTPVKCTSTPTKFASTPPILSSTPERLMTATPALRTLKRPRMTDDGPTTALPNKSSKRRALKFDDEIDVQVQKDLLEVLPANLLHSLMDKERRTLEEQDQKMSQAQRRQQLMAGVPKLLDMIQLLFQSIRRSVMTKQELVHKITVGHLDIVDKGEVEEQLKLLLKVVPEFITEESCFSGDTLLRVNKSSCADSIRTKLLEAC